MLYDDVFRELAARRVRYLIVGGIAVNLHGYARLTMDMDLMLDLSGPNMEQAVLAFELLGYKPRAPVKAAELVSKEKRREWIAQKRAVMFTFIHPGAPFKMIDIFLDNPVDFDKAFERRTRLDIGGVAVDVASVEDLINMKTVSGRPRDIEDVEHLRKLSSGGGTAQ
jgi:predicted nucleotidyltransferase